MAYIPINPNGQATMANSSPVVIASNQTSIPVAATLTAETTKVIGTVNQGTSPWVMSNSVTSVVGNGAAATAQRVTLANDSTGVIATVAAVTAITNALPAGTNVIGHVIADSGSTTAITGNVTAVQATGTNLHVVTDATSTTAVTQATASNLNATVVGTGTFVVQATLAAETTKAIGVVRTADGSGNLLTSTGNALDVNIKSGNPTTMTVTQATGTNLHTVVDSGTVTAVTAITNALPVGSNVIGKVSIDQTTPGTTNKVDIADSLNNPVSAFPATFLRTTDEPHQLFYDAFDTAIDTTDRWTSTTGSSGVTAANTNGVMAMGTGTVSAGYSKLTSKPTFTLPIPAWLGVSDAIALPDGAAPLTNSYRYWGTGTTPGTPTVAAPVTDGYGFELGTDGKLRAVVYAGGTRTVVQDLSTSGNSTQPLDAAYHRYIIYIRTDKAYWYIDGLTSAQLVATSNFQSSQVQMLPRLFLCVGNTTPPVSNTQIQCTGATAWDTGKNNMQISDGLLPWRKVTVKAASTAVVATDLPMAVGLHPTSPLPTGSNTIGALTANQSVNLAQVAGATTQTGSGTATGAQRVEIANNGTGTIATVSAFGTGTTGPMKAEDAGSNTGDQGIAMMVRRKDVPVANAQVSTDEDYLTPIVSNEGALWMVPLATTTGGATTYKLISGASTNATNVKNAAGKVLMITASNTNAAARWLKLYNKASAPTVGTDTPVHTFIIPGNTAGTGTNIPVPSVGLDFATGISFAITTGVADSDTGSVAANDIVVNLAYK